MSIKKTVQDDFCQMKIENLNLSQTVKVPLSEICPILPNEKNDTEQTTNIL